MTTNNNLFDVDHDQVAIRDRHIRKITAERDALAAELALYKEEKQALNLAGREIDHDSLRVDGIDRRDWPDFCDAYFSHGKFKDGTDLTDDQLQNLGLKYQQELWNRVVDMIQSSVDNFVGIHC